MLNAIHGPDETARRLGEIPVFLKHFLWHVLCICFNCFSRKMHIFTRFFAKMAIETIEEQFESRTRGRLFRGKNNEEQSPLSKAIRPNLEAWAKEAGINGRRAVSSSGRSIVLSLCMETFRPGRYQEQNGLLISSS